FVGDRDLAGVPAQDPRRRGPTAQGAERGRGLAAWFDAFSSRETVSARSKIIGRSGRCKSDRAVQIVDGPQEAVGRRGLRIDKAVQAKAVFHSKGESTHP